MVEVATFIQCYRRPKYLKEQLDAIRNQTVPSTRLWIIHNEGGKKIKYPRGAQVIYARPNLRYHLRFAVGLLESADYLAFFDDDTIPGSRWYENCLNEMEKTPRRYTFPICVTSGVLVSADFSDWTKVGWQNPNREATPVDFGGHAWFMDRMVLARMWRSPIVDHTTGEDIMLSANAQDLSSDGSVGTIVPPHPPGDPEMWGSHPHKAIRYGSDKVASWIVNPTHFEDRLNLIRHYVNQGWRLVNATTNTEAEG